MTSDQESTPPSKKKRLEIWVNLVLALASVVTMIIGVVLNDGPIFGVGLLLLIFFVIYLIYGLIKEKLG